MSKIVYGDNGNAFHFVPDDYEVATGEILFDDYATPEQLAQAFAGYVQAVYPSLDDVRNECRERIFAQASATTQSNMNGYMTLLTIKALSGNLAPQDTVDMQLFQRAMVWINAMRTRCAELVGVDTFRNDDEWPPLDEAIIAFAARF